MLVSLDFFQKVSAAAANETMPRFRNGTGVVNKEATGFDPVTEADKAAERVIRALINEEFPDHGIIGEEYGRENDDAENVWVIDPIDGTRAFISGLPLWGTLVGLTNSGRAVAGMMSQPFTGEIYFSDGEKSACLRNGVEERLNCGTTADLEEAILMTTSPFLFSGGDQERYNELEASVKLPRYGYDCYAYAMLAAGHVDLVCESGLHPYDIVALIPIIEKAGGVVSTWDGGRAEDGGRIIAAANQRLHEKALEKLAD